MLRQPIRSRWTPCGIGLLGIASFLLLTPVSFAAKEKTPISVKAEVDRAFITIGDPVEYKITVRRDPSVELLSSIPAPSDQAFKIKKIEEFKQEQKGEIVQGRKITLTAFRLGEFILDPVKIEYRIGNDKPQTIETNRIFITVKSVAGKEEKTDIRGVKSVLSLPQRLFLILLWVGILSVVGVIGFLLYLRFRKHPVFNMPAGPPPTPEEEALLALNQLFDSDFVKKGKIKDYYLKLSEILRVYLEKRFQVLAVESTTFEIIRLLRRKEIPSPLLEKIGDVLEAADLAKFAKWKPEPAEILDINKKSKQIVDEAKPREVESGV